MFKNRHKILNLTKKVFCAIKPEFNTVQCYLGSVTLKSLCIVGLMIISFSVSAQKTDPGQLTLKWNSPAASEYDGSSITFLRFDGAIYNFTRNRLPFYEFTRSVDAGSTPAFSLEQMVFEPLSPEELKAELGDTPSDIVIEQSVVYDNKIPSVKAFFNPVRRNSITGKYEKLVSARIVSSGKSVPRNASSVNRVYAANSVLASGDWFKIAVTGNGVFKVSYSFLANMGVDMNSVTLQNIRLFGNGGGMVPQLNSIPRYDDLQENAIDVTDANANGVFDQGDYFIFYGQSPDRWSYNTTDNRYHHLRSLYSDSTFYFISFSAGGNAKRINSVASLSSLPSDRSVTSFTDYAFHEVDDKNFLKSGREWYGETFDINTDQHFLFNFPGLIPGPAYLKSNAIARTTVLFVNSYFKILTNGTQLFNQPFAGVGDDHLAPQAVAATNEGTFTATSSDVDVEYQFIPYNSTSIGWLNYIELNVRRNLLLSGAELSFRDYTTAGSNASFTISGSSSGLNIWNITDPLNIYKQEFSSPSPGTLNFIAAPATAGNSEFIAFTSLALKQPYAKGRIANQNLHALLQADYLIVTSPEFTEEAQRLADFHRSHDSLKVNVVTVSDIYNEFSSGAKDVSAVRDFTKMFYDRATAGNGPRYLLLFGDASYDYKDRLQGNTDLIPTYQSVIALDQLATYATDDFFGYMDDTEGDAGLSGVIDIGVGRLPVKNISEARAVVDKVITYSTPGTASTTSYNTASSSSRLGDWRNVMCFIADDQDHDLHLDQSERIMNILKNAHPEYNYDKIYFDSYLQVSTPGGKRFPEVSELITRRVEKGALLMNYTGHGGEVGWAHEQVLTIPMINSWKNINNMPAFVTATCEFTRYDDPQRTSAGELLMLNPDGGACCLFTTSRVAFASTNETLNTVLVSNIFSPINNELPRVGDIQKKVKSFNSTPNFILVGDPAMRLSYPSYKVATTSILETATQLPEDTMQALSHITIKGMVTDNAGQKLTNFNGVVYPTIYDKEVAITTLSNDADSETRTFKQRKNIIYRGKASVTNGDFSCSFIVPRDIAYQYGKGRLSYYAHNGSEDAIGYDENFYIGGLNAAGLSDDKGPQIKLFMNSDDFVFGGLTDQNPNIYAVLTDSSGINTVGNGIGHDLSATLDGNQDKLYILNDYYESDLDNFQQGRVLYPLEGVGAGRHTLELKAWDINNNSSMTTTEFVVAETAELALAHV
ncbi:MAG: type IX secretion system sortase PorU, partial [Bacteroidota bacterium]